MRLYGVWCTSPERWLELNTGEIYHTEHRGLAAAMADQRGAAIHEVRVISEPEGEAGAELEGEGREDYSARNTTGPGPGDKQRNRPLK